MTSTETLSRLEQIADEFTAAFGFTAPPIQIDETLNRPHPGMWEKVDLSQLTLSFSVRGDRYAPRVSFSKLVVRQLIPTPWGVERGLPELIGQDANLLLAFARMLLVPRALLNGLPKSRWNPVEVAGDFHVPEDDAEARLELLSRV
ncbi:MAG: hypothetical protein MUC99_12095 [Anaerolineae bacterium]|jgi:hypothetical protein|nr:hypothetical protein [Anaerolineae bacterium]